MLLSCIVVLLAQSPSFDGLGPVLEEARAVSLAGQTEQARSLLTGFVRELEPVTEDPSLEQAELFAQLAEVASDLALIQAEHDFTGLALRGRASLGATDPLYLDTKGNFGVTKWQLGDLAGAKALLSEVYEVRMRDPESREAALVERLNLGMIEGAMGNVGEAHDHLEGVLVGAPESWGDDHPHVLIAKNNLAVTKTMLGDLPGASTLFRSVLEHRERTDAPDSPALLEVRQNLAVIRWMLGDAEGADALFESLLATHKRLLPADHPRLLQAYQNFLSTRHSLGDLETTLALSEIVLEAQERRLDETHPDLLAARQNHVASLHDLGHHSEALEQGLALLELKEKVLHPDHAAVLLARETLGAAYLELGDFANGRPLIESVVEAQERIYPPDHMDLLRSRDFMLALCIRSGDVEEARVRAAAQIEGMRALLLRVLGDSPREAQAAIGRLPDYTASVLHAATGIEFLPALFSLLETRKHVATAVPVRDESLDELRSTVADLRSRLQGIVMAGPGSEDETAAWRSAIAQTTLERDDAEGLLRSRSQELGAFSSSLDAAQLAAVLPPGGLAIGFSVYHSFVAGVRPVRAPRRILAMTVDSAGALQRVELGPADAIAAAASQWRQAIGAPLGPASEGRSSDTASATPTRGLGVAAKAGPGESGEPDAGRALRELLIDPVFAAVGAPKPGAEIFLTLDDFLHLLPLDALPLGADGAERLGDRWAVRNEISFARLLAPTRAVDSRGMVLVGDVDYDHAVGDRRYADPVTPIASAFQRSARFGEWSALAGAGEELDAIDELFQETFEGDPLLLAGDRATVDAFEAAVAGKRFVHVATHGWFAPESVVSVNDSTNVPSPHHQAALDTVRGLAPMTLCGLCFAGANLGEDAAGRATGILTAEELAGYDLSDCALAVLSACETNVGIQRAGQGILSLQTALHAAGARTAITSLWKVGDQATRALMESFYEELWRDQRSPSVALWHAKRSLRASGHSARDWAGWVLTGNPD